MTAALAFAAVRIAFAIVLDAAALVIWDVGTRSPATLVINVRDGFRRRAPVARGALRFATGAVALVTAVVVSAPAAADSFDFTVIECLALIAGLVVEQLVGPDLRARSGNTRG